MPIDGLRKRVLSLKVSSTVGNIVKAPRIVKVKPFGLPETSFKGRSFWKKLKHILSTGKLQVDQFFFFFIFFFAIPKGLNPICVVQSIPNTYFALSLARSMLVVLSFISKDTNILSIESAFKCQKHFVLRNASFSLVKWMAAACLQMTCHPVLNDLLGCLILLSFRLSAFFSLVLLVV